MANYKAVVNKDTKYVKCCGFAEHPFDSEIEVLVTCPCQELYIDNEVLNKTNKRSKWNESTENPEFTIDTITLDDSIRPKRPRIGNMFFDTDLGIPIWWDGSNWINSIGTIV